MEYIDALNLKSTDLNSQIVETLKKFGEVTVSNPHSMHNIAIGLSTKGKVIVDGSTGFYVGGFLEGTTVEVTGNTGWYAGDNMMGGELLIKKNTGCNAGCYLNGGTMLIYGGTGSRVGYGMKAGTIIVCGNAGRWAGQMTLGGKLVLLGNAGQQVGESMYKGTIFTCDNDIESKLGGNVFLDNVKEDEIEELDSLFVKYGIKASARDLKAVRPALSGRHTYVLFNPILQPELSNKNKG